MKAFIERSMLQILTIPSGAVTYLGQVPLISKYALFVPAGCRHPEPLAAWDSDRQRFAGGSRRPACRKK
jgi:hypothetical protein